MYIMRCLRTGEVSVRKNQAIRDFNGHLICTDNITLPIIRKGRIMGAVELARDVTTVDFKNHETVPGTRDFDRLADTIKEHPEGELEGFQKVTYAGHDFETAVKDADVVMVVATGEGTVPFAKACKPYVKEGQMFFICPGSCFGSVEFKRTLGYDLADESIVVAETHTLPYAVRISEPGKIRVANRLKGGYYVAGLPSSTTKKAYDFISTVYEEIEPAGSVVATSLQNANPAIHPSVMLSNIARVENQLPWLFYHEGVTTGVGRIIKAIMTKSVKSLGLDQLLTNV